MWFAEIQRAMGAIMKTGIDRLREWIEHRFNDYVIEGDPVTGTYGLIWFIKAKQNNFYPQTRALKTLNPDDLMDSNNLQDIDYLKREFRMWMELPPTFNVIGGIKIYIARLPTIKTVLDQDTSFVDLPVMMMERMKGNLKSWIGNDRLGVIDRLFALAQAFNGLIYLYSNGIEGHGDLKPENFLYADLREKHSLDKDSWLNDYPWIVKVSDLGWANAWVDYGYTTKAFRPYLAPERIETDDKFGVFIPQASDMFSMGIIAAELLQGRHPAKNLNKAKKSEGEWVRWAKKHEPELDINSIRMKSLIMSCLDPDYSKRPTAEACFDAICCELIDGYSLDVAPTLKLWRQDISNELGVSKTQHTADVAIRTISLGGEQVRHTRKKLEDLIEEIEVSSVETCIDWTNIATSLLHIYEKEGEEDSVLKIRKLRLSGLGHLASVFGNFHRTQLNTLILPGVGQQFERLADVVIKLAYIADITYENALVGKVVLSDFALSAFAFGTASAERSLTQDNAVIQRYLEEAVKHAPDEATPFYFRALWGYMNQYLGEALGQKNVKTVNNLQDLIKDLETACDLEPTWREPGELLNQLRDKSA